MSDLVAHFNALHVKFCTINALLKHYVLIASRQCFNSVSVKCLGPFFFPYGLVANEGHNSVRKCRLNKMADVNVWRILR